jgi:nicotinamidase-related amidase
MTTQYEPNRPEPKPVSLDVRTTAVVTLDLSARCHDPQDVCSKLMQPVGEFLERVRDHRVPIVFTVSAAGKGSPLGEVASPLKRRQNEPVIYPDAFDKFASGELQDFLRRSETKSIILVGSSTNIAVLYTCSTAARVYGYKVVIPLDGINTRTQFEQDYAIHQLTILPADANKRFEFTTLSGISFRHEQR